MSNHTSAGEADQVLPAKIRVTTILATAVQETVAAPARILQACRGEVRGVVAHAEMEDSQIS